MDKYRSFMVIISTDVNSVLFILYSNVPRYALSTPRIMSCSRFIYHSFDVPNDPAISRAFSYKIGPEIGIRFTRCPFSFKILILINITLIQIFFFPFQNIC